MQPAVKLAYSRDTPATFELLDERFGVRVETMLAHWLDDEVLAARLRRPVLLAVARGEIVGRSAADLSEDWVFGEARREARALIGPEGIAGVIPVMRKPTAAPPPPAAAVAVADEFDYLDEDRPESSFRVPPRWIWFGAFMALIGGVAAYGYFRVADAPDQRVAAVRLVPSVPVLPEPAAGPLEDRQARSDRPPAERPAAPPTEPAPAAPQQQDLARPAADPEPSGRRTDRTRCRPPDVPSRTAASDSAKAGGGATGSHGCRAAATAAEPRSTGPARAGTSTRRHGGSRSRTCRRGTE